MSKIISEKGWVWLGILCASIWIWYAVFKIGFFHTLLWIVIGGLTGGLYSRYKDTI